MSVPVVDFREAKNITQLAIKIGCDKELIYELINSDDLREFYYKISLTKKNIKRKDKRRVVWQAATAELANVQKALLKKFEDFALNYFGGKYPHSSCHGFVRGRSTATNAKVHLGKKYLIRADIKNFFESISCKRLMDFLQSIGIDKKVAEGIVALTTINDSLGQGINSSPLFANLVFLDLDDLLEEISHKYNCSYSRYADDLSFSSDDDLFVSGCDIKDELSNALKKHNFKLSQSKFRISKNGQAHFVTGLSISDPDNPHVPKKFKRKLRQELYFIRKYGIRSHSDGVGYSSIDNCLNNIDGRINYLRSIEPILGSQYHILWDGLLKKEGLWPDYQHTNHKVYYPRFGDCYIDESEFELEKDTKALALALVFTDNAEQVKKWISDIIETLTVDDYSTVDRERLSKKGLHFTKDHPDMRSEVVRNMAKMPIQCYVAFQRLGEDKSRYQEIYLKLFEELLRMRMSSKNRYYYSITVEESSSAVEKGLVSSYGKLREHYVKHGREVIASPKLKIAGKLDEICLSMADYFLGVIKQYIEIPNGSKTGQHLGKVKHFERLRHKIRFIYYVDAKKSYWRKNPLIRVK